MTTSTKSRNPWLKPLVLFSLTMAMVVAVVVWNRAPNADPVAIRASELAFEANGALENEQFTVGKDEQGKLQFGLPEAIKRYEEILQLLPDEELPYRNLAIARLIAKRIATKSDDENPASEDQYIVDPEQAKQDLIVAMEEYLNRFETPVASFLHGEILHELGSGGLQSIEKIEKYFAAAQAEPDHAPFWFKAAWESDSLLVDPNAPESLKTINAKSLLELRRLCPQNLWVIRKSLIELIGRQDEAVLEYWSQTRPIFEKAGFASKNYIGKDTYYGDLSKQFDFLDTALNNRSWSDALSAAIELDNVINGKLPSVNDIAELQPNPLDYLMWQFSDQITQAAEQSSQSTKPTHSIQLINVPLQKSVNESGVLDYALADVDFDGLQDLFVLRATGIDLYRGPVLSDTSERIFNLPLAGNYSSIQAGFLLTIGDKAGSGIRRAITEATRQTPGISPVELPQIMLTGQDGLLVYELKFDATDGYSAKLISQPESMASLGNVQKSVVVDFDQDADLDLVVIVDGRLQLLMNRGNNTFLDASQWLYLPPDLGPLVDVQFVDWNRDLYMDLLVQTADGKMGLLDNERHGAFRYRALDSPLAADRVGFVTGELDGNASWDLIGNSGANCVVQFSETKAWGRVQWLGAAPGTDSKTGSIQVEGELMGSWQLGDFDNSTTQDLLLWKDGQLHYHPTIWRGTSLSQGAQRLAIEPAATSVALSARPQKGERLDIDNDGDLDLLIMVDGKLEVLRNEGGNKNPWLAIVPLGQGDNASRTNHLGIGSLMEARIGPHYFAETITRPYVHVGLGSYERPNLARIIWTNGIPQTLLLPPGRQTVEMLCILKGSCPFIYTWDGKQWQFLSDCLWAAPIGLQAPGGGLVPTRNWEYMRLGPDTLSPADGTYRIMLTEELWEVAYFDQVRLFAVDHPADVEVHINDKVGPPEIVQHRLYQVSEKTIPTSATDQNGNDVLPELSAQDNRFVKSFSRRLTQGYVEPHDLILDFGTTDLENQTLFLTGWIQPTDTSINVMLQQNPDLPGPQFPAMFVIGSDGQWQPASRPMGFPGGKTKTMAVPLNELFPTSDQRLKITSSAEIYWDHAYVSENTAPVSLQQHEATLVFAKSFYRGTSRRLPLAKNGPENFDAYDIATESVWPPVSGAMTPYGDSLEVLTTQDNRLVTLGTGDAVELRFQVPSTPIPAGHRRTFLLYTVGYDKDSDLHTLEGQRIEPLPTAEMTSYPDYAAGGSVAQTIGTRQQNWYRFWRQIQNPQIKVSPEETKVPRGEYRR